MRLYGWVGLSLLLVSHYCLFQEIEPIFSWFYCFAWWSYILLADNLLFWLRGRSLLMSRRPELWRMLPLSVFIWLLFEGYNFVINNWAYEGVEPNVWLRWPGYSLAFATVLPAIFITTDLCEHLLFGRHAGNSASEKEIHSELPGTVPASWFWLFGGILSVAPCVAPRYFFPTVWLGPIFLLDPFLEKLKIRSLSMSIYTGDRRRVWSLFAGGLTCGLLWEFFNFWAPARWIYTVPFFTDGKVFEMPLLGFLGFPPFALECWILYHLLSALSRRWDSAFGRTCFWLFVILISISIFRGIDFFTVVRYEMNT
jgi:hypothetical protein